MTDAPNWLAQLFTADDWKAWDAKWRPALEQRGVQRRDLLPEYGGDPPRLTAIQADPPKGAWRTARVDRNRVGAADFASTFKALNVELDTPGGGHT